MKKENDNFFIIKNKNVRTLYKNKDNNIVLVTKGKSDAEYLKEILSKNLKSYMDKKGKNATDLSKELDIKYSTVRDWCNAKNYPRVDKIQLLANYFNINTSDLTEDKPKNKVPVLGNIPARYTY